MSEKKRLPPDDPLNLAEWLWRVRYYGDSIFVREQVNERWKTVALGSLSIERWAAQVARMLEAGMNPVRIVDKGKK